MHRTNNLNSPLNAPVVKKNGVAEESMNLHFSIFIEERFFAPLRLCANLIHTWIQQRQKNSRLGGTKWNPTQTEQTTSINFPIMKKFCILQHLSYS